MTHHMDENSFLQEIDEELTRQKLDALWKKYGPTLLGGAAAIVIITAAIMGWKSYHEKVEQEGTAAYIETVGADYANPEDKIHAFDLFAEQHKGTALAVFDQIQKAATLLKSEKKGAALDIYKSLSSDESADPFYRDLASLLIVQTELDTAKAEELEKRLTPLMADTNPWRFIATEYAGHLAVREGNKARAIELFGKLAGMDDLPQNIKKRSQDMLTWLKGEKA